ncbi:MAG TPA: hypothetical protein VF596_11620 [Pyrinomonadaceae bacterium]
MVAPKPTQNKDWDINLRDSMSHAASEMPSKIPPTARGFEDFRTLRLGMSRGNVISKVGRGDKLKGSMLYIEDYYLSDGSIITLSSSQNLLNAVHHRTKTMPYQLREGGQLAEVQLKAVKGGGGGTVTNWPNTSTTNHCTATLRGAGEFSVGCLPYTSGVGEIL